MEPKRRQYDYDKTPAVKKRKAEHRKKWNRTEAGKKYLRRKMLKERYGLTLDEFDGMMEYANGACHICGGVNADGKRLYIDHNHSTGAVRGLLCKKCNAAIGMLGDDQEIIGRALKYLESGGEYAYGREE